MKTKLMNDTFRFLQQEISPVAGIILDLSCQDLNRLISVMDPHHLSMRRQTVLLALYSLLIMAEDRHRNCSSNDADLTKRILDGDYLYSLYLQVAVKYKETGLAGHLAPVLKRQQIAFAEGKAAQLDIASHFDAFLCREYKQKHAGRAI